MPSSDKEKLLNDVLRDPNYEAHRKETLELCRAEFRKERKRSIPPWFAMAASLLVVALLVSRYTGRSPEIISMDGQGAEPQNVEKQSVAYVSTGSMAPFEVVRSVPDRSIPFDTRNGPDDLISIVESDASNVREISDQQLLAIFEDQPAGFVHKESGKELVIFSNFFGRQ